MAISIKKSEIIEIKTFSEIPGFSFEYPVFKGWEVRNVKKINEDEYSIILSSPEGIKFEVAPQIRIIKSTRKEKINLKSLDKNLNRIAYSYNKGQKGSAEIITFYSLTSSPIDIYPFLHEGDGYSGKFVINKIIETFKFEEKSNIFLSVKYGSGESSWIPWEISIDKNGKVSQEIFDLETQKKQLNLSKREMNDLIDLINNSNFFKMKNNFSPKDKIIDLPTIIIIASIDNKSNKVSVYGFGEIMSEKTLTNQTKNDLNDFKKIYNKILQLVPSPNKDQTSI